MLTIVLILGSSALYFNNKYVERQTFELFYNQLKLDVTHIQMMAITEEIYMKVVFFETEGSRYLGRKSVFEETFERHLPPGYHWSSSSTLKEIAFHPNGTVNKFGTLVFITPYGLKTVRIFIGKGCMVLE